MEPEILRHEDARGSNMHSAMISQQQSIICKQTGGLSVFDCYLHCRPSLGTSWLQQHLSISRMQQQLDRKRMDVFSAVRAILC